MSKRSATQVLNPSDEQASKRPSGSAPNHKSENDEMGEFEDAWEDEIESDGEVVDAEAAEGEEGAIQRSSYMIPPVLSLFRHGCGRGSPCD